MSRKVLDRISSEGLTLSVAESCTGGKISATITSFPGSSSFFLGGIVAYNNDVKLDVLGISRSALIEFGAVSEAVAMEMAERSVVVFGSNLSVAVTGVAGPHGGTELKPVGMVFIAASDGDLTIVKEYRFEGDREDIRNAAVEAAFELLGELLKNKI